MDVADSELDGFIANNSNVIVDFWAPWCGPCRAVSPVLEKMVEDNPHVLLAKVNVDENPDVSQRFDVQSIPMIVAFKDGERVKTVTGAKPRPALEQEFSVILNNT